MSSAAARFFTLLSTPLPLRYLHHHRPSLLFLYRSSLLLPRRFHFNAHAQTPTDEQFNDYSPSSTSSNGAGGSSPLPEWYKLLNSFQFSRYSDRLHGNLGFDKLVEDGASFPGDFVRSVNACSAFAREHESLLWSFSRKDTDMIVENGSPFLFKDAADTRRRMKSFLNGSTGPVAAALPLPNRMLKLRSTFGIFCDLSILQSGFFHANRLHQTLCYSSSSFSHAIDRDSRMPTIGGEMDDTAYVDMPTPRRRKAERKPYPTPMNVLIKRAKEESELRKANPCRVLEHPPDNGLLVLELVDVARQVYYARESLLVGISKLIQSIPVQRCRFCFEVHVGPVGHDIRTCTGPGSGFRSSTHVWRKGSVHDVVYFPKCYHLYDRVGKPRVVHNERSNVPRVPAISELCIQAGMDLKEYPTKRRTKPVYCIEGRIEDFKSSGVVDSSEASEEHIYSMVVSNVDEEGETLEAISNRTLSAWFEMINGTRKMMDKYTVWTCGYCPEIQVGPKGHKVRMCKASKHQTRDGMHAWQEATTEDLMGPNYVWHVRDPSGPPLDNKMKRFYGKAPALVELCVQGGADVPDEYRSMMRLDVVPPDCDEVDLVA